MSCDGLTLGKIIFGYTPRVVLPPQQPVLNATMEQIQRWGEDISNDGLDAIYRVDRGIRNTSCQISFEFLFIKTRPPDKLHTRYRRGIE